MTYEVRIRGTVMHTAETEADAMAWVEAEKLSRVAGVFKVDTTPLAEDDPRLVAERARLAKAAGYRGGSGVTSVWNSGDPSWTDRLDPK